MHEYATINRELWDTWADLHPHSAMYDIPGFVEGRCTLKSIELDGLGDVTGQRMLHLQCHIGTDTLSWARRGAEVTGVDLSPRAVAQARELATRTGQSARFVACDVYDLPEHLDETFDIVFTSYGVLCWLRDLGAWGRLVARYLRPGGRFFMSEFHPLMFALDDATGTQLTYPFFRTEEPLRFPSTSSYTGQTHRELTSLEWPYTIGHAVQALLDAGLQLDHLQEHDYSPYGCTSWLEEQEPGIWRRKGEGPRAPLVVSVGARKPG